MNNKPLISVIIANYNSGKTLSRALESVISQDYSSKELIVVDGMSTDNSSVVLKKHNDKIDLLIREPDSGVYDAINKGIRHAKGEWIYILGADDYLSDSSIFSQVFSSPIKNQQIIFGKIKNENITNRWVTEIHDSAFDSTLYWKNSLHQQSVFYSKSLFDSFEFNVQYKILADYDFHLFLLNKKVGYINLDLLVAHCEASGLSKNFHWGLYSEELRMKRRRLPLFLFILNVPFAILKFSVKKFI